MRRKRPSDPALWFFLAAFVIAMVWSFFLALPPDLSPRQLEIVGVVWRAVFFWACLISAFGCSAGLSVFKEHAGRWCAMATGAVFGCGIVAVSRLPLFEFVAPLFEFLDIGATLIVAGFLAGLMVGLVIGFRKRKVHAV